MKRKILLTSFTLVVIVFLSYGLLKINFSQIYAAFLVFSFSQLLIALGGVLIQILFQSLRYYTLFPKHMGLGFKTVAKSFCVGQFVNTFVPARAGDVVKVLELRENRADSAQIFGIVIADKFLDVIALVLLMAVTSFRTDWDFKSFSKEHGLTIVFIFLTGIILYKFAKRKKEIYLRLKATFQGIKQLVVPKNFFIGTVFALLSWATEAFILIWLCHFQNISLTLSQSFYVLTILNMGIAIPVSIANLGVFEASMVYAFLQLKVGSPQAIAIATIHHALQMAAITLTFGVSKWKIPFFVFKNK